MPAADDTLGKVSPEVWKAAMVRYLSEGLSVDAACERVGRSKKAYEFWRAKDPLFKEACNEARAKASRDRKAELASVTPVPKGSFEEFSIKYLGSRMFDHQVNMVDAVEGREPSRLHDTMIYEPGSMANRRVLLNLPPNHAKTMSMSVGYVTYRICMDPNINILLISKTQEFAKKIMYAVKQRLTHPRYSALQMKYGPVDGFKANADQWTANKIYLGSDSRDSGSKDPTLEAIGMGGQIYGARADLILLDDVVTLSNAGGYESQADWIRQEVASRLGPGGQIIVMGTRVASMDLYRHLREPDHYTDGVVPWTYLAMPAVLEYGKTEDDWLTLWPESDEPFVETDEESSPKLYPRWTGPRLAQVRNEVGPRKWSLVYQQADVADDSTFDAVCVRGSVEPRNHGPLEDTTGWHVVMGVDPAISGQMALCVVAGDRDSAKFKVLTVETLINPTPSQIRELIISTADAYSVDEVVIEDNAFQGFLAQDEQLRVDIGNLGAVLRSHHTGSNKTDPDFGVASMASLFGTRSNPGPGAPARHQKDSTLLLPNSSYGPVKILVEELVAWNPELPVRKRRQDCVMALWFAVKRLREFGVGAVSNRRQASFAQKSSFTSARSLSRQMVVSLSDFESRRGA